MQNVFQTAFGRTKLQLKIQTGQILLVVIIVLAVVTGSTLLTIGGAQLYYSNSTYSAQAEKATDLAEAGVDKALQSLNRTGGSYNGETETALGDGSYSVTITSKDAATKVISATGYIPNKLKPKAKRTVRIEAARGIGASFKYGVQVGDGGLELGNNNTINGSIYSNGNITAGNNNIVTGDAWVAGGQQPNADQQTDCVTCQDYVFGKNVSGEDHLDIAQSFQPQSSNTLNKISLKLKKFGNPSDITVRILADSAGSPDKNSVLATGTLFSSLVTTSYGWIDVTFSTTPNLTSGTSYWIMLDTSSNSTNYWAWQNDLAQSYTRGLPKWSADWSTNNPTWNSISGDLSFQSYMGGVINSISGDLTINMDAHAHSLSGLTVGRDAYFQSITNTTVSGSNCPNSHCHPGTADPPPGVFPISQANIDQWKAEATVANPNLPAPVCGSTWGPGKYTGDVNLSNNCTVTIAGNVYITGNVNFGNSDTFKLDSSYGTTSGLILIDGKYNISGNSNHFEGTGQGSSLLVALTTFDSRTNNQDAITIGNSGNTGVFYAGTGILNPGNSNTFTELTAWKIRFTNNAVINYTIGLSSTLFSSGPSGTFTLVKGTYQLK